MKTKKIISLIFVAIFTFSVCKGKELEQCDLPKGLIPYQKGQTYSFIDDLGQFIDVPATENVLNWLTYRPQIDNATDYISYRREIVELKSESNDFRIHFIFDADGCITGRDYNKIMITVGILDKNFVVGLIVDAEGNFLTDSSTFFHESIEINGKVYHDVIEQNSENNMGVSKQIFYNKTYGILQVNRNGESFLSINQKTEEIKSSSHTDILNEEFGITSINDVKINTSETKLLRIYAVTGALVYSSSTNFNLKSAYLNKGIYIVETTNNLGEVKREKIVVK